MNNENQYKNSYSWQISLNKSKFENVAIFRIFVAVEKCWNQLYMCISEQMFKQIGVLYNESSTLADE